jgi:serine/threonine protein kinase
VRAVIDRFTGREYACKRLPKAAVFDAAAGEPSADARAAANAAQLDHIKREIGLFTKLRSSLNVAKLEQVYEDRSHVYLVMEMCKGPTLEAKAAAEGGTLPEGTVAGYMRSVVRTIAQVRLPADACATSMGCVSVPFWAQATEVSTMCLLASQCVHQKAPE